MFEFDTVYIFYGFAAVSAILFVEGVYLLFFSTSSYRSRINRRLALMTDQPDREGMLVQLRRERGLTSGGDYRLPIMSLSKLILQSGLTIGFSKLLIFIAVGAVAALVGTLFFTGDWLRAAGAGFFSATALPYLFLRIKRGRRLNCAYCYGLRAMIVAPIKARTGPLRQTSVCRSRGTAPNRRSSASAMKRGSTPSRKARGAMRMRTSTKPASANRRSNSA